MQLIKFNNYLKVSEELPSHLKYVDYMAVRELPEAHYRRITKPIGKSLSEKTRARLAIRDRILLDLMWESGGRVGDVVRLRKEHFDFRTNILTLNIKKSKKTIRIPLSNEMTNLLMNYYLEFNGEPLKMTRQNAWAIVKKYGKMASLNLNPHMFRHGLGVYLFSKGADIQVIAHRLGHADPRTTAQYYCKITPELEREYYKSRGINFR
jgi:integrase/recombinase XerD